MRCACIDIGTNSVKHSIYDGRFQLLERNIYYIRIGEDIEKKWLSTEKRQKAIRIITKIINEDEQERTRFVIIGTCAFRTCRNGKQFASEIRSRFSVPVKIVSGKNEARLAFAGASPGFKKAFPKKDGTFIDIGAGSSEIIFSKGHSFQSAASLETGSLRIKKRFRKPSSEKVLPLLLKACSPGLLKKLEQTSYLAGIGGSFSTAAKILLRKKSFDAAAVEEKIFVKEDFFELEKRLRQKTIENIRTQYALDKKRADLVPSGLSLINAFLKIANPKKIHVSTEGVSKGAVITFFGKKR